MPSWYHNSLFLLHYDHHYSPTSVPAALTGLDAEQVERLLRQVRPDAVQVFAKGHPGFVPYPTRFGNALPSVLENDLPDVLALYREITRKLDIRLVIAYSGLVDHHAADWRPDWQRTQSSYAPYPNRGLCPNTSYVEEMMLPQLDEILERCRPDGIWTDADNWTVSPCYCSACTAEFRMLHDRQAPWDRSDPFWPEWLRFHRDSFNRYVSRVARYLHERDPELVYVSNSGYCTHHPEPPPQARQAAPDRLTWDISPAYSLRQAGMEARFLGSRGIPWDLMTWNRCSARPWPQGRLPALPAYPKSFPHLAQEGAVILANGGRWSVWVSARPDDALPEEEHGVVAQAAEFARARRPWCLETESAAYVAVLHSERTHQRAGNGLYDPGPCLDRIRGAHQALLELHHPHDLLSEDALLRELERERGRYRVIVLPEQIALSPELEAPLADWVQHGGRLIASGRVAPRINEEIPVFALEELLGVQWTGRMEKEGFFVHRDQPLRVAAPVYPVALNGAETVLPLLRPAGSDAEGDPPAVTRHRVGQGEVFYVAADFFAAFHRCQYPGFRDLLGDVLELALPEAPFLTTAPPTVEVVLRRKEDQVILHFVNHSPGKSLAQNSAFIEEVPPSAPFSVTLALPVRPEGVRLQPDGTEPEWSYAEGTLAAFIPPVHVHEILVIS